MKNKDRNVFRNANIILKIKMLKHLFDCRWNILTFPMCKSIPHHATCINKILQLKIWSQINNFQNTAYKIKFQVIQSTIELSHPTLRKIPIKLEYFNKQNHIPLFPAHHPIATGTIFEIVNRSNLFSTNV